MDQGIAAALAGVAGLIGAGIGGLATAYGARVGAQKTLESVQVQVQQQAVVEHSHWLRDQRRQVCSDITVAWTQVVMPVSMCLSAIDKAEAIADDRLDALGSPVNSLADACALTSLWGPDRLIAAATRLREATAELGINISMWNDTRGDGDQAAIDAHQRLCVTLRDDFADAYGRFVATTRSLLEAPD